MPPSSLGTALITGSSTGIGAVYADRLARRGYDLILVARNRTRLDALASKLSAETGRKVDVLVADLTKDADVDRVGKELASNALITLLVNNAGSTIKGGILDNEADALRTLIALNVTASAVLAAEAAKAFKARGTGAIINIASVLALAPEMFDGFYSATKAFLFHLSRGLSKTLENTGVYVQSVLPGATRTEIWDHMGMAADSLPAEMLMEVHDLVDASLVGFDRREAVTIPPLADESLWLTYDQARGAMLPKLSTSKPAARYEITANA